MTAAKTLLPALTSLLAALVLAPQSAWAVRLTPCDGQPGYGCGTLRVPLDRTGAIPGTVTLHLAAQDTAKTRAKPGLLIALSGGPGQSGADFASSFADTLRPLLRTHRLVTIDQRGTGASGPLKCPEVQALDGVEDFEPAAVAACAARVGPRRKAYGTRDSVDDLEAVRRAFGAPKLALMGVSYGTFVAQQYARVHPRQTAMLVLDSVIGPKGVDPFLVDTYSHLGRVLTEQCARKACDGVTADPLADVAVVARRLEEGSIAGRTYTAAGRPRTTTFATGEELFFTLISADLNPFLQAALPGALASAVRGDAAPLVRLRQVAAGGPTPLSDLSGGLNVITSCLDVGLPYSLTSPLEGRETTALAALAAIPPASYAPWDPTTVFKSSYVDDCLRYPDGGRAPSDAPLPAVPTLLLSGRLDLRTPLENALAVQAEVPGAQRVTVPGTGHDELDSDITGCVALALRRFADGRRVGTPCVGRTNAVDPFPRAPLALSDYNAAPGVERQRGRLLFAVLDTAADARATALERLFGGLGPSTGGLRGGSFTADAEFTRLQMKSYSYVPGVRVSGLVRPKGGMLLGPVTVTGPGGLRGSLKLTADGATGTLGGRHVRYSDRAARAATAATAGSAPRLAPRAQALQPPLPPRRLR